MCVANCSLSSPGLSLSTNSCSLFQSFSWSMLTTTTFHITLTSVAAIMVPLASLPVLVCGTTTCAIAPPLFDVRPFYFWTQRKLSSSHENKFSCPTLPPPSSKRLVSPDWGLWIQSKKKKHNNNTNKTLGDGCQQKQTKHATTQNKTIRAIRTIRAMVTLRCPNLIVSLPPLPTLLHCPSPIPDVPLPISLSRFLRMCMHPSSVPLNHIRHGTCSLPSLLKFAFHPPLPLPRPLQLNRSCQTKQKRVGYIIHGHAPHPLHH